MKKILRAIWEPLICAIFVPIILAAEAWHRRQERKFYGHDDRMIRSVDALLDMKDTERHEAMVDEALEAEKIFVKCSECGKNAASIKGIFQGRMEVSKKTVVIPGRIWTCACGWVMVEMETEKNKTVSFVASQPAKEKPGVGLAIASPR